MPRAYTEFSCVALDKEGVDIGVAREIAGISLRFAPYDLRDLFSGQSVLRMILIIHGQ